jgi:hypothetical protein
MLERPAFRNSQAYFVIEYHDPSFEPELSDVFAGEGNVEAAPETPRALISRNSAWGTAQSS